MEFRLDSILSAFLRREHHFIKNGVIAFVISEPEPLHGYVDAAGNDAESDFILSVNGLLSTAPRWEAFDIEWQEYLERKGFEPENEGEKCVFHTTKFHTGNQMPKLRKGERAVIHNGLVDVIKKHRLFNFGYAVAMQDVRDIEREFPDIRELWIKKPGTELSQACFNTNEMWAHENGYNRRISYIFDQGDHFFPELKGLYHEAKAAYKKDPSQVQVGGLTEEDKRFFSPLQAADLLAWECRNYCLKNLVDGKVSRWYGKMFQSRALRILNVKGESSIWLKSGKEWMAQIYEKAERNNPHELFGTEKIFPNLDEYIRGLSKFSKVDRRETQKRQRAEKAQKKDNEKNR